jgi:Fe2+/Zn2+ uptake regulation proteins
MNSRNTIQRSLVLDAMYALAHPTAEDVYEYVSRTHLNISRATVYRNLKQLVNQKRLVQISFADAPAHFDTTLEPHYHMQCLHCGAIADVELPLQHSLLHQAEAQKDYKITAYELNFYGDCPDCRAKTENCQLA